MTLNVTSVIIILPLNKLQVTYLNSRMVHQRVHKCVRWAPVLSHMSPVYADLTFILNFLNVISVPTPRSTK